MVGPVLPMLTLGAGSSAAPPPGSVLLCYPGEEQGPISGAAGGGRDTYPLFMILWAADCWRWQGMGDGGILMHPWHPMMDK